MADLGILSQPDHQDNMENEQHYSFAPVYCVPQADGQGTGCLHILSPAEQYQSQMKNLEIQHFDVFLLLFFVVKFHFLIGPLLLWPGHSPK